MPSSRDVFIFFSAHARKPRVFKYLKRAERVNCRVYLKNILSKCRDNWWQYSPLEATFSKFFFPIMRFFFPVFLSSKKRATFSSLWMLENTRFSYMCWKKKFILMLNVVEGKGEGQNFEQWNFRMADVSYLKMNERSNVQRQIVRVARISKRRAIPKLDNFLRIFVILRICSFFNLIINRLLKIWQFWKFIMFTKFIN